MVYLPCPHVTGHIPFACGANVNIRFFLHNAVLHRKLVPTDPSMVYLPCLHVTGHIPFASGANVNIRFFLHNAVPHRKLVPTHGSMVYLPCLHVTGHIPFASGANVKHTLSQRPARPTPGNGYHMRAGDLHGPCVYCSPQTFGKRDKHIGNSCLSSLLLLHLPATSPSPSRWHCSAVCSSFLPACLCFLPKPGSDREMHPQPHACCYLSLPARVSTFI